MDRRRIAVAPISRPAMFDATVAAVADAGGVLAPLAEASALMWADPAAADDFPAVRFFDERYRASGFQTQNGGRRFVGRFSQCEAAPRLDVEGPRIQFDCSGRENNQNTDD